MDIKDSRKCNIFNLNALARYFEVNPEDCLSIYMELLQDSDFINQINNEVEHVKKTWGFNKGIFSRQTITSVDWFAFERILIYVLIRIRRPDRILETGVYYGGNTVFALKALERNGHGFLVSIDFPDAKIRKTAAASQRHPLVGDSEFYQEHLDPGFIIPRSLKKRWQLIEGDSLEEIPRLADRFDLYIHDSDHSMTFLSRELGLAEEKLTPDSVMVVDDIDWSNAFYQFCVNRKLWPLLLTDNGKDDLRVRTGVVYRKHPRNGDNSFT